MNIKELRIKRGEEAIKTSEEVENTSLLHTEENKRRSSQVKTWPLSEAPTVNLFSMNKSNNNISKTRWK